MVVEEDIPGTTTEVVESAVAVVVVVAMIEAQEMIETDRAQAPVGQVIGFAHHVTIIILPIVKNATDVGHRKLRETGAEMLAVIEMVAVIEIEIETGIGIEIETEIGTETENGIETETEIVIEIEAATTAAAAAAAPLETT